MKFDWKIHILPGDALCFLLGVIWTIVLGIYCWSPNSSDQPTRAIIRAGSEIVADVSLPARQVLKISGPLGQTVIVIEGYQAKVDKDPSPRQYCVSQGWLTRTGDIDICLPNRVSIQLLGHETLYDSLNY